MLNFPSFRVMTVSRNASLPLCSRVNLIVGSNEFRVLWNISTAFFLMIEELSSTYRFQVLGE